jgi:hypothetical protein
VHSGVAHIPWEAHVHDFFSDALERAEEAGEIPDKGKPGRLSCNQLAVICSNKELADHYPIYVFLEKRVGIAS